MSEFIVEQQMYPDYTPDQVERAAGAVTPRLCWVVVNTAAGQVWDAPYDTREEAQEVADRYNDVREEGEEDGYVSADEVFESFLDFMVDPDEDGLDAWDERRREQGVM